MNTENISEIEVVDQKGELLELYIKVHGNERSSIFEEQMKELVESQQRQICGMSQQIRNLRKEHLEMKENQIEILKELQREQIKNSSKNQAAQVLNIQKLHEDQQKMQKKCRDIIKIQEKDIKKFKLLANQRHQKIDELESSLKDRNDRLLVLEEELECWKNKKCADMQKTIRNLQKNVMSLNDSEKRSHKLIANQQMVIHSYQSAFCKIQSKCIDTFCSEELAFLMNPKIKANMQVNHIDQKYKFPITKPCSIVLIDCVKKNLRHSKTKVELKFVDDSSVQEIHDLQQSLC